MEEIGVNFIIQHHARCKEHTDGTNINNTLQEELSRHSAHMLKPRH